MGRSQWCSEVLDEPLRPPLGGTVPHIPTHPQRPPVFRTLAAAAALTLLATSLQAAVVASASDTIRVSSGKSAVAPIGSSRITSIAQVKAIVPANGAQWGIQLRAASTTSGYLVKLKIGTGGNLVGAIKRLSGKSAKTLHDWAPLGVKVKPGQSVRLEATVTATANVRTYMRAWVDGEPKPVVWQMSASDTTSSRYRSPGRTYVWAAVPERAPTTSVSFPATSVHDYSAASAGRISVVAPLSWTSSTFSLAVIPDTQVETNDPKNTLFLNRVDWLTRHKSTLNVAYALHTGDMTNWGWLDAPQIERAQQAMARVRNAGIPYALTVGNHDTRAVGWNGIAGSSGYGGSAYMYNPECPGRLGEAECKSWLLVRHTEAFNKAFPLSSMGGVGGAYEAGKSDNYWTTFEAGGTKWLVLTLEPWPRKSVVTWAQNVLATHRSHNVIIQIHHYLTKTGTVSDSNAGYGDTSPQYLREKLVAKYPNVKLIFSGHTGAFAQRVETVSGNRVAAFVGNDLGAGTNPLRIVTIDTRTGRLVNTVYNPVKNAAALATSTTLKFIH